MSKEASAGRDAPLLASSTASASGTANVRRSRSNIVEGIAEDDVQPPARGLGAKIKACLATVGGPGLLVCLAGADGANFLTA